MDNTAIRALCASKRNLDLEHETRSDKSKPGTLQHRGHILAETLYVLCAFIHFHHNTTTIYHHVNR
jgi:hypothetical protein